VGIGQIHLQFPGMICAEAPWVAIVLKPGALSVILTWLYGQAGGNVLGTIRFHAAQSFFVFENEGISLEQQSGLMVVVFGVLDLALAVGYSPGLRRESLQETAAIQG
jgi:hypothetical protein